MSSPLICTWSWLNTAMIACMASPMYPSPKFSFAEMRVMSNCASWALVVSSSSTFRKTRLIV
nr:hypothetical protein [Nocardiopsis sp. FR4]